MPRGEIFLRCAHQARIRAGWTKCHEPGQNTRAGEQDPEAIPDRTIRDLGPQISSKQNTTFRLRAAALTATYAAQRSRIGRRCSSHLLLLYDSFVGSPKT